MSIQIPFEHRRPTRRKPPTTPAPKERISPTFDLAQAIRGQSFNNADNIVVKPLLHFEGNIRNKIQTGILFSLNDYLQ